MTNLPGTRARIVGVLACLLGAGCLPQSLLITPVSTNKELEETELFRESAFARDTIAILDLDGIILNAQQPRLVGEGEHPVSLLTEQLDKARRDRRVKAVILRINSPGGSVTASELMHDEIRHFKKSGKPVVAVMMDVAASGGYYIACACDKIFAQRSTVTGSIGVIMQLFDATGTMKLIGLSSNAITSGPRKDSGSPFKQMTDDERATFQAMVDDMYAQFVEVVAKGRPNLGEDRVRQLADGRVYTANQAVELGLVDRIATMRETLAHLKRETGAEKVRVVTYHRPLEYRPNYYARSPVPQPGMADLLARNLPGLISGTPTFMYLWAPGL